MGDSNLNIFQPTLSQPKRSSSDVSVGIYWDIEKCLVLSDISPDDVAGNITEALRGHPLIKGAVAMFSAYGDFNSFPRYLREGCQRTDVPKGKKDAANKAILVEMFMGEGFVPPSEALMHTALLEDTAHINDNLDGQNKEDSHTMLE